MKIDEKILNEISRYRQINKYILEQEVPPIPDPADPAAAGAPPADPAAAGAPPADPAATGTPPAPAAPAAGEPVDVAADPDVEEVTPEGEGGEGEGDVEELDITDLVDSQKTMADKQEEYFENLFNQIKTMEEKLAEMDSLVQKIDLVDAKLEKYRPKTAQEKLELRSLDSGPYKQNLADFFKDKEEEMERSGKNEYVLTKDDVENYSPSEIEQSFNEPMEDEDDMILNRYNS
jgi:hypothetical protein